MWRRVSFWKRASPTPPCRASPLGSADRRARSTTTSEARMNFSTPTVKCASCGRFLWQDEIFAAPQGDETPEETLRRIAGAFLTRVLTDFNLRNFRLIAAEA